MIITIGRKKFAGSMIDTLKETNCGGLNIKETRLGDFKNSSPSGINRWNQNYVNDGATRQVLPLSISDSVGRWPANVLLEGEAIVEIDRQGGVTKSAIRQPTGNPIYATTGSSVLWNSNDIKDTTIRGFSDEGGVSRYFFQVGEENK